MLNGPHYSNILYSYMTGRLDLNYVDIVGIRVEPLVHVPNIKK